MVLLCLPFCFGCIYVCGMVMSGILTLSCKIKVVAMRILFVFFSDCSNGQTEDPHHGQPRDHSSGLPSDCDPAPATSHGIGLSSTEFCVKKKGTLREKIEYIYV